jgi:hypothetical protein
MDTIPYSACVMAMGLLIIVWLFLLHMFWSKARDAHAQFLLDLIITSPKGSDGNFKPWSVTHSSR